jgi:hypothetical protein
MEQAKEGGLPVRHLELPLLHIRLDTDAVRWAAPKRRRRHSAASGTAANLLGQSFGVRSHGLQQLLLGHGKHGLVEALADAVGLRALHAALFLAIFRFKLSMASPARPRGLLSPMATTLPAECG